MIPIEKVFKLLKDHKGIVAAVLAVVGGIAAYKNYKKGDMIVYKYIDALDTIDFANDCIDECDKSLSKIDAFKNSNRKGAYVSIKRAEIDPNTGETLGTYRARIRHKSVLDDEKDAIQAVKDKKIEKRNAAEDFIKSHKEYGTLMHKCVTWIQWHVKYFHSKTNANVDSDWDEDFDAFFN